MAFLDMGCGDGFFTIPAVRKVGGTGRIYAVDSNPQAITRLQRTAQEEELKNIFASVSTAEETVFCESCADYVFLGIVLHDFKDPNMVLQNARRMLKPDGNLVNLDWRKTHMPLGPPHEIRFDEKMAAALIQKNSFTIEEVTYSGSHHYLVIAHPSQGDPTKTLQTDTDRVSETTASSTMKTSSRTRRPIDG